MRERPHYTNKESLHPPDLIAQAKMQEALTLLELFKENMPTGSFFIDTEDVRIKPVLGVEVSPKKTMRKYCEFSIKLKSYI